MDSLKDQIKTAVKDYEKLTSEKELAVSKCASSPASIEQVVRIIRVQLVFLRRVNGFFPQALQQNDVNKAEVAQLYVLLEPLLNRLVDAIQEQRMLLEQAKFNDFARAWGAEQSLNEAIESTMLPYLKKVYTPRKVSRFERNIERGLLAVLLVLGAIVGRGEVRNYYQSQAHAASVEEIQYHRQILRANEHLVDDTLFSYMFHVIDKAQPEGITGFYFPINQDAQFSEVKREILTVLSESGFSADVISRADHTLILPGNILIRESAVFEKDFRSVLVHERIHAEWDKLPKEQSDSLLTASIFISTNLWQQPTQACSLESLFNHGIKCVVARGELRSSYYEFYSYLSMGIFSRSVEEELRVKFPQAYKIYRELLERSQ